MKIILQDMKKSFGEKQVLKGVDYTFMKGKIYGLLGRNGAGKTTLFNCISKEIEPDSGKTLYEHDNNTNELSADKIGYVLSTPILPDFLTGYEFIKFYMDINKGNSLIDKSVDEYLDLIKFEQDDRHRLIKGYSHGMKNKIQMLCFIISKPPVILLDEPLTSFDVVVAIEIKKLLKEFAKDHIIIFSTHILQLAVDMCDEIVVIHEGKLSGIDNDMLKKNNFEETIIDLLKDENSK